MLSAFAFLFGDPALDLVVIAFGLLFLKIAVECPEVAQSLELINL